MANKLKEFEIDTFKGIEAYERIEVWWLDAQHGTNIIDYEDLQQLRPLVTKNIGYLLKETKEYIILGYMLFDNDCIKHWQLIPKGMIIKKVKLTQMK